MSYINCPPIQGYHNNIEINKIWIYEYIVGFYSWPGFTCLHLMYMRSSVHLYYVNLANEITDFICCTWNWHYHIIARFQSNKYFTVCEVTDDPLPLGYQVWSESMINIMGKYLTCSYLLSYADITAMQCWHNIRNVS